MAEYQMTNANKDERENTDHVPDRSDTKKTVDGEAHHMPLRQYFV